MANCVADLSPSSPRGMRGIPLGFRKIKPALMAAKPRGIGGIPLGFRNILPALMAASDLTCQLVFSRLCGAFADLKREAPNTESTANHPAESAKLHAIYTQTKNQEPIRASNLPLAKPLME